jgi:hypothetical protein
MRTTLQINDHLYRGAKQLAVKTHRTLTQVVEDGLRLALATKKDGAERVHGLVLAPFGGKGLRPGIDLDDMGNLLDAMDKHDTTGR